MQTHIKRRLLAIALSFVLSGPLLAVEPGGVGPNASAPDRSAVIPPNLPPLPAVTPVQAATEGLVPLTPQEIRALRKKLTDTRKASAEPSDPPPKPRTMSALADLSPGGSPIVVRVAYGFGAVLAFFDSTGAAWPIQGKPTNFNDEAIGADVPIAEGSTLAISAKQEYASASLVVYLKGLDTPIPVSVVAGRQKEVDSRMDVQVPRRGPNAKAPVVEVDTRPELRGVLSGVLEGVPPRNASPLKAQGGTIGVLLQAWRASEKLYLRTYGTVMSPKPTGILMSSDGTSAYELPYSPVVLISQGGQLKNISFSALVAKKEEGVQ